jgi:hypothetical protein
LPPHRIATAGSIGVAALGLGLLAIAGLSARLNGDVQYVLGGLTVAGDIGFVDTFVHRPLTYRAIMAGLNVLAGTVAKPSADLVAYEAGIRLLAWAAAAFAGGWLWFALVPRVGSVAAASIACAGCLSLMFSPQWDFLQAEWVATLLGSAAVAAALMPWRTRTAAGVGGLLLAMVVGVKLVTLPLAAAALIVVAISDRSRARPLLIATTGWMILLAMTLAHPLEWQWSLDMAALNAGVGDDLGARLRSILIAISEKAIISPIILLAPAATVLLVRLTEPRRRPSLIGGAVVVGLLCIIPLLVQSRPSLYNAAALPVAASMYVAGAGVRWWTQVRTPPWPLLVWLPVVAIGVALLVGSPTETRISLQGGARVAALVVVTLSTLAAAAVPMHPARGTMKSLSTPTLIAGLIALLAFVPAMAPASSWSIGDETIRRTNASWELYVRRISRSMQGLSEQIGRETPVLYLAYGDIGYHMGNPTDCRYPSPLWIQRGTRYQFVQALTSHADNLDCLARTAARYIVLAPGWAFGGRLTGSVRDGLRLFDCSAPTRVAGHAVCARADDPTGQD